MRPANHRSQKFDVVRADVDSFAINHLVSDKLTPFVINRVMPAIHKVQNFVDHLTDRDDGAVACGVLKNSFTPSLTVIVFDYINAVFVLHGGDKLIFWSGFFTNSAIFVVQSSKRRALLSNKVCFSLAA